MSLELTCKLEQILSETNGTGKNGPWIKQDFLVETIETYPKKVCMGAWNELAGQVKTIAPGSTVKIAFRIESREYNARWYTDVRPTKIDVMAAGSPAPTSSGNESVAQPTYATTPMNADPMATADGGNDDLPF